MSENSDVTADIAAKPAPQKRKPRATSSKAASKANNAFRTISEVSEELDVPQHVLRFWETKFTIIKPMKRAGGRRYYRPQDVELLKHIQRLLHDDGYTIKGVQKVFKSARGVSSAIEKAKEAGVETTAEAVSDDLAGTDTAQPEAKPVKTVEAIEAQTEVKAKPPVVAEPKAEAREVPEAPKPAAPVAAPVVAEPKPAMIQQAEPSKREQAMEVALRETLAEFRSLRDEIDGLLKQMTA